MAKLALFSVSSLCLAFVAVVGLGGYTTRLPDDGLVAVSLPVIPSLHASLTRPLAPHSDGCATRRKLVG